MARRCIVILGGTGGIGIATVRKFFEKETCDMVTLSARQEEIDASYKEFANPNGSYTAYLANVTDEKQIAQIYKEIDEKFGKIDVLINAVGTLISGDVEVMSPDSFRKMVEVNLTGVFIAMHEAIPYLKKAGTSYVVNLSSLSSKVGGSSCGYSAAKAGVDMLSRDAARDLAKYGVRVNTINPGMTNTGIHVKNNCMDEAGYKELLARVEEGYPLGIGKPEYIAGPIYFLCTDEASWLSGENILVDGCKVANFK